MDKLTESITIKITSDLKNQWQGMADRAGIDLSVLVREWAIKGFVLSNLHVGDYLTNRKAEQDK